MQNMKEHFVKKNMYKKCCFFFNYLVMKDESRVWGARGRVEEAQGGLPWLEALPLYNLNEYHCLPITQKPAKMSSKTTQQNLYIEGM